MRTHQFRDCKAWLDEGLPLSTTSNEAAKLYDAVITQFVGWYDDPEFGGMVNSMTKLVNADPEFVLGLSLVFGLKIVGTLESISSNESLRDEFENLRKITETMKSRLGEREYSHSKAVQFLANGEASKAAKIWDEILLQFPTDLHALKMVNLVYFYCGESPKLRDSIARVLPDWEVKRPPLKSFLYGMYAFGLQEMNEFKKSEQYAQKGLSENKSDGFATHALAHVFYTEGRIDEGLDFMSSTVKNWEQSSHLACHNYWHLALLHIEDDNFDAASDLLEKEILNRAMVSKTMLDISDCSSLLSRIHMLSPSGHELKESHRSQVFELCKPYSKRHISTFNDIHYMMAFSEVRGQQGRACIDEMLESLNTATGEFSYHPGLAEPLLRAIADFADEKFDRIVESLEPLRYKWREIGGSNAQLDILNLMLIVAAMKSSGERNKKLAKVLINERMGEKADTELSRRLDNQITDILQ